MDRVFLDANVLFSAAYRADSGLVELWQLTASQLLTSAYALSEAERNLAREDQRRRLAALVRSCEIVPTPSLVRLPPQVILPDNDEPILLAAIAAEATHPAHRPTRLTLAATTARGLRGCSSSHRPSTCSSIG